MSDDINKADNAYREGLQAERNGTPWYENPNKSGSVEATEWDRGHTKGRKMRIEKLESITWNLEII